MIAVNLNSRIINPAPQPDLLVTWQQFQLGGDRHRAGDSYTTCTSDEQQRGFIAAHRAAANTDADIYLRGGAR